MQLGFYFDQSRCSGCLTCVIACLDWHDIPEASASWIKITATEQGQFPNVYASFLASLCHHCAEPPCIPACPTGAIIKREEDGIVVVDKETCLGKSCCTCQEACPYDIPQ
ncbi:4Fe-4S dicluster domain-containing protein, partial [Chloroflexota bacterium]